MQAILGISILAIMGKSLFFGINFLRIILSKRNLWSTLCLKFNTIIPKF